QPARFLVRAGVHLDDASIAQAQVRHNRSLIWSGSDHDIGRLDRTFRSRDDEPGMVNAVAQGIDTHTTPDRRPDACRVCHEVADDLLARGEAIGISTFEGEIGKPDRPIRELETKTVPPLGAPALRDLVSLEDTVPKPSPAEHIAHCQPGLAAA